ncbi:thiol reductant ABC exporter subunit CydD [Leifsonia poae]|uniref:thiol reductant ABC exporter subunit CydD n=1 Tax=Leifsonia poae TaxID=110933 RepID=UPI001CC13A8B|nr:thiol reductant ABC exporter subunit CydD [Leifsonia poae]
MRPFDPRLLRYARAARGTLVTGGALALLQTACVIAFAWLVTQLIVRAIAGDDLPALSGLFAGLVLVIAVRGVVLWLTETTAARGGSTVIGQLREALVGALGRLGPGWLSTRNSAEVTLTVGRGLDALDGYFTKYLPQLILTALATPVLVAVMFWQDATSGIIVLITLPLIPLFMVLVGWATQAAQARQWSALSGLSRGFLDVVDGLSTLKLFGRQHRQSAHIRDVSEEYRARTMKVLRMSFLSGFVLELAASLSVAVVAVAIGLRLLNGQLDLSVGLFVLLLAPEAFLPLRNVGAAYHAATEGIAAAHSAFETLEAERSEAAPTSAATSATAASSVSSVSSVPASNILRRGEGVLVFDRVTIDYRGRTVVREFSATVAAGVLTVLSAPSGAGKSSLVGAALGFVPFEGRVSVADAAGAEARRASIAWAGQHSGLLAGSVSGNVALGSTEPDALLVAESLRLAAVDDVPPSTVLGVGGAGLSGGQAQRVAVARALYRMRAEHCPLLVLDEPTSALDDASEARLVGHLREIAAGGVAVLVISHRDAVVAAADTLLTLEVVSRVR